MSDNVTDLRQRLLDAQEMTPGLRDAYQVQLAAMLDCKLSPRLRLSMLALLLLLVVFVVVGLRALIFYYLGPFIYGVWIVFTVICSGAAIWIGRSIWRGRFIWNSYFSIADLFTVAAMSITVLVLGTIQSEPSDPKSIVGVFYPFTLLTICIAWSLHNRISAAELAAREHMLRIECRLAKMVNQLDQ